MIVPALDFADEDTDEAHTVLSEGVAQRFLEGRGGGCGRQQSPSRQHRLVSARECAGGSSRFFLSSLILGEESRKAAPGRAAPSGC